MILLWPRVLQDSQHQGSKSRGPVSALFFAEKATRKQKHVWRKLRFVSVRIVEESNLEPDGVPEVQSLNALPDKPEPRLRESFTRPTAIKTYDKKLKCQLETHYATNNFRTSKILKDTKYCTNLKLCCIGCTELVIWIWSIGARNNACAKKYKSNCNYLKCLAII